MAVKIWKIKILKNILTPNSYVSHELIMFHNCCETEVEQIFGMISIKLYLILYIGSGHN